MVKVRTTTRHLPCVRVVWRVRSRACVCVRLSAFRTAVRCGGGEERTSGDEFEEGHEDGVLGEDLLHELVAREGRPPGQHLLVLFVGGRRVLSAHEPRQVQVGQHAQSLHVVCVGRSVKAGQQSVCVGQSRSAAVGRGGGGGGTVVDAEREEVDDVSLVVLQQHGLQQHLVLVVAAHARNGHDTTRHTHAHA